MKRSLVVVALVAAGCGLENPSVSPGTVLNGGIILPDGAMILVDGAVEAGLDVPFDQQPVDVIDGGNPDVVTIDRPDAVMDSGPDSGILTDRPMNDVVQDGGTDTGPRDSGPICTAGQTLCGTTCVVTSSDPANCGACGNACAASPANGSSRCTLSVCELVCDQNFADCDSNPVNGCEAPLQSDSQNCAVCGTACAPGSFCSAGVCRTTCAFTVCGGVCVDTRTSPMNCGGCGTVCTAQAHQSVACTGGSCVPTCDTGFASCDGIIENGCEAATTTDVLNCGGCGNACPARANAIRTCGVGGCGFACNVGFGDCNGTAADGCEVDINTALTNCGGCGLVCPARANATNNCALGVCGFTCNSGFGNCDGNATNGCETALTTTVMNCGTCGNICPARTNATPTCAASTCGITCNSGFGNCDGNATNGCELNTTADPLNCGACGNRCDSGRCSAGVCLPVIRPGVELGYVTSRGVRGVRVNVASVEAPNNVGSAVTGACLPISSADACRIDLRQLPSPEGTAISSWNPNWGFEVEILNGSGNPICAVGDATCGGCWNGTVFSCLTVRCTDSGAIAPAPMVFTQGYRLPPGHFRLRLGLNTPGQRGFCSVP